MYLPIREMPLRQTPAPVGTIPVPASSKRDETSLTRSELMELFASELTTIKPLSQVA